MLEKLFGRGLKLIVLVIVCIGFLAGCSPKMPTGVEMERDLKSVREEEKMQACGYLGSPVVEELKILETKRKGDILTGRVWYKLSNDVPFVGKKRCEEKWTFRYIRTQKGWEFDGIGEKRIDLVGPNVKNGKILIQVGPLNFYNEPADLVPSVEPKMISVSLQGPRNIILGLERKQIKVYLDLKGKEKGQFLYPAEDFKIKCPEGVRVVRITPQVVSVNLEPLVTKEIDLVRELVEKRFTNIPVKIIQPSSSLLGARLKEKKATLVLRGPQEAMAILKAKDVTTAIDVSDLFRGTYKLKPEVTVPPKIEVVSITPSLFEVTLGSKIVFQE